MRITADTNILVSATFWYGSCDKIIAKVEEKVVGLVISKKIINEYSEVLNYKEIRDKIKDKNLEMIRSVERIRDISEIIEPKEKVDIIKEDPDDNMILECAKSGKVDYIVTKDKHLLKLKQFENIPIITPDEFLKKLK